MNKQLLFLLIVLNSVLSFSQNLTSNPSFEYFSQCPNQNGQLPFAVPWFTPYYWVQSSEYFNMCDSTTGGTFPIYLVQKPRTGNGIAAIAIYSSPSATTEYREYIEVKLKEPLKANNIYCVSYYVSLIGYSTYAIDALCSCFTADSLLNQDPNVMLLPCSNMTCNTVGNIIKDTLNWTRVIMSYTALGGEQFITIGNFKTTSQTNAEFIALTYGWNTYYFIDDVAVYECDTPAYPANTGGDKCMEPGDSLTLGTPQRAEYLYWWYDMQGNLLDTTAILTVSPTQTTSYILVQKDFKFDETRDTVTITVGNCPISGISFEIYPNPCNGEVKVRFNGTVPAGAAMQVYDMVGRQIAQYPLAGTGNIATVNFGELATGVYHATVVVPDVMKKSVKLVVVRND